MLEPIAHVPEIAVARAERRMWLLHLMFRFCAALLKVVKPQASVEWQERLRVQSRAALVRAMGLIVDLKAHTERRLRDLKGEAPPRRARRRAAAPPPPAPPTETPAEAPQWLAGETRRQSESQIAFRARVEALEAFLEQEHLCANADLSGREVADCLCKALGFDPAWARWINDDWLADNLSLKRLPALSPPAAVQASGGDPPPGLPPAGEERIAPLPLPPGLLATNPGLIKTYQPGFREALAQRVMEAIEAHAHDEAEVAKFSSILERRLAANEPYMWGGYITLRGAVDRLCEPMRIWPDWKRWKDNRWIDDGYNIRRLNAERDARIHAKGRVPA